MVYVKHTMNNEKNITLLSSNTRNSGYSVSDILKGQKGSLTSIDRAMGSVSRATAAILENGIHHCHETKAWRIYNKKTGTWKTAHIDKIKNLLYYTMCKDWNYSFQDVTFLKGKEWMEFEAKINMYEMERDVTDWNILTQDTYDSYLPFNNVVLDIKNKKTIQYSSDLYIESKIERDYDYNAGCDAPVWDKFIKHLSGNDSFIETVLEAWTLKALIGRGEHLERTMLFLYNESGGAGKGTLIKFLMDLVGKDRSASYKIDQLSDQTTLGTLKDKTFIAFPEERQILSASSNTFARLLSISSQDEISGRVVFSSELFQFQAQCMIAFASNFHILPSDSAASRRLLTLRVAPAEQRDPYLLSNLRKEMPMITNRLLERFEWNIEQLDEIIENAANYKIFLDCARENADETSTINKFLAEMVIATCPINKTSDLSAKEYKANKAYEDKTPPAIAVHSLYQAYKHYLEENNPGARPLKRTRFEKEVANYYRILYHHDIIYTEALIPGLIRARRRFLGIIPNPMTWIDVYQGINP